MATTKVYNSIWSAVTLTAGAGDTTSTAVDLSAGYGGQVNIKLTNGATGPTIAAQVQVQFSADDTTYYDVGGPLVGSTDNNGVSSWSIEVPIGVEFIELVGGSNTSQAVTVNADISNVTAV